MTARSKKSDPAPLPGAGLGEVAYTAYLAHLGRTADWGQLVEDERDVAAAWCAVGQAVITATFERKN